MNDQDEMFEAATETPISLGCPAHMPKTLPGGFDGVEPGEDEIDNPSRLDNLLKKVLDVIIIPVLISLTVTVCAYPVFLVYSALKYLGVVR